MFVSQAIFCAAGYEQTPNPPPPLCPGHLSVVLLLIPLRGLKTVKTVKVLVRVCQGLSGFVRKHVVRETKLIYTQEQ